MAQAGRTRGRNGRKKRPVNSGVQSQAAWEAELARIRRQADIGVVPGGEESREFCPVCSRPSEGWYISEGKREWYHFGRTYNCVERMGHIEAGASAEGGVQDSADRPAEAGALPEVRG